MSMIYFLSVPNRELAWIYRVESRIVLRLCIARETSWGVVDSISTCLLAKRSRDWNGLRSVAATQEAELGGGSSTAMFLSARNCQVLGTSVSSHELSCHKPQLSLTKAKARRENLSVAVWVLNVDFVTPVLGLF